MVDSSKFASDDSNAQQTKDTSDSVSNVHLFMVENGDPSERDAALHHEADAYELLQSGGTLYNAWTKTQAGSNRNEWSRSDVASHILADFEPLVEHFGNDPEAYTRVSEAMVNALVASFEGDTGRALGLYDPDASDIVDFIAQSDDVSFEDITQEVKDRQSDDESDE